MVNIQSIKDIKAIGPQRVNKYLLVSCETGQLTLQVDEKEITLKENEVLTITSGQYHHFTHTESAEGFLLEFTLDFFAKTEHDIELIFQNSLFCHFDYNEVINVAGHPAISRQMAMIKTELNEKPFQYLTTVHSRIELILVDINRAKLEHGGEIWKPEALFLHFLEFVRNNFEYNYSLNKIAARLKTTELKLNEQAKLHAGKTAQKVIYGLIISEAKRILQYEPRLFIKEVAHQLGFDDPYYFTKFFKNHTGLSPTEYQKSLAK
ncbi:helix-turn-helix domain-containing protein [Maribacter arenosus]|uniref:AraC family transcriptional regulator n=1 Tax=Maribacter arenosus TaxID=1854708 RepID=A0ABR7VBX0_9FLAO|nr:helix-turn-helix domain-containing protein [Maribacter arenosus]MBD0850335.1 AraC family transcriptional regulator [Maribacter arenosus]